MKNLGKTIMFLSVSTFFLITCGAGFGQKITPTADQFSGTWRKDGDVIKIRRLGGQRLKVEYEGIYEYKYQGDPIANIGTAKGIALIQGNAAQFQDGTDADCQMTLKFSRGRLEITSAGCTFGQHVNAAGIYRRASLRKPKFDW